VNKSEIIDSLCRAARVDRSLINEDSAHAALGLDSLGFMNVIMRLEEEGGFLLSDDQVDQILACGTIGEIVAIFEQAPGVN
jgi:acyl carrier protein